MLDLKTNKQTKEKTSQILNKIKMDYMTKKKKEKTIFLNAQLKEPESKGKVKSRKEKANQKSNEVSNH